MCVERFHRLLQTPSCWIKKQPPTLFCPDYDCVGSIQAPHQKPLELTTKALPKSWGHLLGNEFKVSRSVKRIECLEAGLGMRPRYACVPYIKLIFIGNIRNQ